MKTLPAKPHSTADALGRGPEFAMLTLIFLGAGYAVDRWLGTRPAFTIGLTLFGLIAQGVTMYYRYNDSMRSHEAERAALTTRGSAHD